MTAFDRVLETSTTTGTGDVTLAGAVAGHVAFSARYAASAPVHYGIVAVDASGTPTGSWELGLGSLSAGGLLQRTTPQASSNGDLVVTFAAGTKRVFAGASVASLRDEIAAVPMIVTNPVANPASTSYGLPGEHIGVAGVTTLVHAAAQMSGQFFTASVDVTITSAAVAVTVAAGAGATADIAIYAATRAADGTYTAGARVALFGSVAVDTIGTKTITGLSQALLRGQSYCIAVVPSAATTFRLYKTTQIGSRHWRGDTSNVNRICNYLASAAFPAPASAPAFVGYSINEIASLTAVGLIW